MPKKSRRSSSRKIKRSHARKTHRRSTQRRRGGADLSGAPVSYHLSGSWPSRMSLGQGADYFKYHEGQHGGASLGMGAYPSAVLSPGLPDALRGPAHIGGIDKAIADVKGLCDPPNCPGTTAGGNRRNRSRRNKTYGGNRRNRSRRNKTSGGNRRNKNRRNSTCGGSLRNRRNRNNVANMAAVEANVAANEAVAAANVANVAANEAVAAANVANVANVATSPNSSMGGKRNRRRGGALGYAPFPSPGMLLSSKTQYAQAGLNPEWKTDVAFTDAKIRDTQ